METRRVDANLLVALDALLTEVNLTRAGDRIGISQPTMSGALARLRRQLGDPLLMRGAHGFELTPYALERIPAVREAVAAVTHTLQMKATFDPTASTRVFNLAASDFAISALAGPLLSIVRTEAPGVSLEFVSLPMSTAVDKADLLRRDLVIASSGRGVPGLRQLVLSDQFVVLVDRRHPGLQHGRLSKEVLHSARYVTGVFGAENTTPVDDMLATEGIAARRAITCRGFLSIPFLLRGSDMVGIVPQRIAESTAAELGLVIAETPLPLPRLDEMAHWRSTSSADPGLRWLLGRLRALNLVSDDRVA